MSARLRRRALVAVSGAVGAERPERSMIWKGAAA
jgi:hypothetical protein